VVDMVDRSRVVVVMRRDMHSKVDRAMDDSVGSEGT